MQNSEFKTVPVSQIIVKREERQRKELRQDAIDSLAKSIKQYGQINPITVTRDYVLVAGERRLEACRSIAPDYPIVVQFIDDLSEDDRQLIEYEENAKRESLTWQEKALATHQLHHRMKSREANWTTEKTGQMIGIGQQHVSKNLSVAEALIEDNTAIETADSLNRALAILERQNRRKQDQIFNDISQPDVINSILANEPVTFHPMLEDESGKPIRSAKIERADFTIWAENYTRRKFDFLHCDFPYGIDHGSSAQGGTRTNMWEGYEDSESTYWELLKALANNLDHILLPKAHVMFWFSMKYYGQTIKFFAENTDLKLVSPLPLVWVKSDGKGIVPDVNRRARQIYETALLFSRGDRRIVRPVANAICHPSNKAKAIHVSEKPEEVLCHFFRMLVDEETEMLDPTCGSGSSICAAYSLNIRRALGVELDPFFKEQAQLRILSSFPFLPDD